MGKPLMVRLGERIECLQELRFAVAERLFEVVILVVHFAAKLLNGSLDSFLEVAFCGGRV